MIQPALLEDELPPRLNRESAQVLVAQLRDAGIEARPYDGLTGWVVIVDCHRATMWIKHHVSVEYVRARKAELDGKRDADDA